MTKTPGQYYASSLAVGDRFDLTGGRPMFGVVAAEVRRHHGIIKIISKFESEIWLDPDALVEVY